MRIGQQSAPGAFRTHETEHEAIVMDLNASAICLPVLFRS
jgi:hypothetical protein